MKMGRLAHRLPFDFNAIADENPELNSQMPVNGTGET